MRIRPALVAQNSQIGLVQEELAVDPDRFFISPDGVLVILQDYREQLLLIFIQVLTLITDQPPGGQLFS